MRQITIEEKDFGFILSAISEAIRSMEKKAESAKSDQKKMCAKQAERIYTELWDRIEDKIVKA